MMAHPETVHAVVPVLGVPFHMLVTPEDGVLRLAGFSTVTDPDGANLFARLRERDPVLAARPQHTIIAHTTGTAPTADNESVDTIISALRRYDAGDLTAIEALPVAQRETAFRGEVWRTLRTIPPGSPVTYAELAERANRPAAVRAAASACANNLVALVVPCHRAVRADGQPGGYLFGTELKARILAHEAAHASAQG